MSIQHGKAGVTGGLRSIAGSVRQVGQNLDQSKDKTPIADYSARYADKAAAKLEQVAGTLITGTLGRSAAMLKITVSETSNIYRNRVCGRITRGTVF